MKGHERKPRSYKDNTHALCFHTNFLANREHLVRPAVPNRSTLAPLELSTALAAESGRPDARLRRELLLVGWLAAAASVASFLWFFLHGQILLYGDAVAHLNIARRLLDSLVPSPLQLGTVWLPLPHLLSAPFVINDWMWHSGVGGSIVSMLAYVAAVLGTFRLVRARASRFAAWLAAALLALNPDLLYMQATAMTESLFLGTVIWSVVYFDEAMRGLALPAGTSNSPSPAQFWAEGAQPWRSLERCAIALAASMLTRYDGWALALVIGCASTVAVFRRTRRAEPGGPVRRMWRALAASALLCALMPVLWLAHNYAINYKPLDWLDGPYSAKVLEQRSTDVRPYPGEHDPGAAALYFVKAAKLNVAEGRWQGWMLALVVLGTVTCFFRRRADIQSKAALGDLHLVRDREKTAGLSTPRPPAPQEKGNRKGQAGTSLTAPSNATARSAGGPGRMMPFIGETFHSSSLSLLLLWFPLPFYAYAIAYGSVPIFVPVWYPFSFYNVRYGLELLPAFAVFSALLIASLYGHRWLPTSAQLRRGIWSTLSAMVSVALVLILVANYVTVAHAGPICLREAQTNSASRLRLESQLAGFLRQLPPESTLLMYTAEHVGALQMADVPLRRVVDLGRKMIWDAGLSCPAQVADYVVAFSGDPVAQAVERNPRWLEKVATFSTPGAPEATVYRSRFPGRE